MSKCIFRKEVGIYEFSFHDNDDVYVCIVGVAGRYRIDNVVKLFRKHVMGMLENK